MDYMNFPAILVAGISALVIGFVWYNPKVFGGAWMKAAGMTDEQVKGGNMAKIFGLALLFAVMIAFSLPGTVIHQMGALSLVGGSAEGALPSFEAFITDYGDDFRTVRHGALHGFMIGLFVALPILGTNALFEHKNAKYIFINSGYWIVTLAIMGGIICAWR